MGSTGLARWWIARGYPVFGVAPTIEAGSWRKRPAFTVDDDKTLVPDTLPYLRRTGERSGGYHQATLHADSVRHVVKADSRVATPGPADLCAIDVDDPAAFAPWADDLWRAHVARTLVVASRYPDRERVHVYCRLPSGLRIRETDVTVPGVDACGFYTAAGFKSGYWVLPTQTRPDDAGEYRVLSGRVDEIPILDPRVIERLTQGGRVVATTRRGVISATAARWRAGEPDERDHTTMGDGDGRNDALLGELGRVRRQHRDYAAHLRYARGFNLEFAEPMTDAEVLTVVNSSWGYRKTDPEPEPDTAPKPAPKPEPDTDPDPEPQPAPDTDPEPQPADRKGKPKGKPKSKLCSYEIGGFRRALRQVGVRIVRVMPSGHVGVVWRKGQDPEELEIDTDADSRLQVLLRGKVRDVESKRYYIPERAWRRTLYRETARKHPKTYAHLVYGDRSDIEGVVRALPAGQYRVRDILIRAGVLNNYQSPAQARSLEKLACRILREHRMIALGPVHRYSRWVSQDDGEGVWQVDVPSQTCARCWRTPAGWQPATVPATVVPFQNRSNRSGTVAASDQ